MAARIVYQIFTIVSSIYGSEPDISFMNTDANLPYLIRLAQVVFCECIWSSAELLYTPIIYLNDLSRLEVYWHKALGGERWSSVRGVSIF